VGALRQPTPISDIQQEPLFTDQLSIVVRKGHWVAKEKDIPPSRLRELDWIAARKNTPARAQFTESFSDKGLDPPIECSSLVATCTLLMNSDRAGRKARVDQLTSALEVPRPDDKEQTYLE
jgi:DNA-binding transcriptional LysR family regulator